ncbi:hypothetical protein [Promicromonospora kroppenstedtii]|uniref:hypothetical protein n=1 Tax=Promicromonospora kroppenstedtii TaxID=440482 RepID=UPI0004B73167|nr:hypothetical protein [Promicromonospora kroppenstedtii]
MFPPGNTWRPQDGDEHTRLTSRSARGPLEHVRTQEHGQEVAEAALIGAALTLARALSTTPGATDMSQHVPAIGTVAP